MYVMDPVAENRTEEKVHISYYQQARHSCGMDFHSGIQSASKQLQRWQADRCVQNTVEQLPTSVEWTI